MVDAVSLSLLLWTLELFKDTWNHELNKISGHLESESDGLCLKAKNGPLLGVSAR